MSADDPGDEGIDRFVQRYPLADITAAEFEVFVVELFESVRGTIEDLRITLHERIAGVDGTFDFDATIRYRLMGMEFLVLVEAKMHKHPIKRELVQALHSKLQSVGAHKAVWIATSYFQTGAIDFAKVHGIALVGVTEGRFTYETRSADQQPPPSRAEAQERLGLPTLSVTATAPEIHRAARNAP